MRQADFYRGQNRALIDQLANGSPPWSPEEQQENGIEVSYNDLSLCRSAHDGRSQLANAFMKPGNYFKCSTDMGPMHRRTDYGAIVTREMNRIMKRSIQYFETYRSKFALDILHGIGPAVWPNPDRWCPKSVGIDDVLIPGGTTLDMDDLPFYSIHHSWTAPQLIRKIRAPQLDPGWNVELAEACLEWIDQQTSQLMGSTYQDMWSPEKLAERIKSDGCPYASDQVPTMDVFDFHFWHDDGKVAGWRRRIILDAWSDPTMAAGRVSSARRDGKPFGKDYQGQFLYSSGNEVYSDKREQVISFQFADLSAVGPFRYHSVRSIGFLLYAVCHIQNRMRCKFTESVFEALMMYFRVKTEEDMQRALKVKLWNRGFIDETLEFVKAQDRFQVNANLVELGLKMNDQLISDSAASYTQNNNFSRDRTEKTKFQVMAEVNAAQSLVSAGLLQAYAYQEFEDREILRRFMRKDSTDPDVKTFRAACLRQRVPEKLMIPEAWDCAHERILGTGNKTQEMQIVQFLMENRNLFPPESQQQILHMTTVAVSDNAALGDQLVPTGALHVSDSKHDAQLAIGTLLQGLPVDIKTGMNPIEYIQEILKGMAMQVKKITARGGVATEPEIEGLVNAGHHVEAHIKILAQDEKEKATVKQFGDVLGNIMNEVKAFAQRLQQQREAEAQQNGNGGLDPKDAAKIKATMLQAQTKAQITKQSHAERTAQKRLSFEQQLKQKEQQHQADIAATDLKTAAEIHQNRFKSME